VNGTLISWGPMAMIALSLSRCKPFLTVLSCDCRLSVATGPGKLQVQSRPLRAESDRQPSDRMSRRARPVSDILTIHHHFLYRLSVMRILAVIRVRKCGGLTLVTPDFFASSLGYCRKFAFRSSKYRLIAAFAASIDL
jgi:hypothetical protein